MLRRGIRRLNWHGLHEFALQEADAAAFRVARAASAAAGEAVQQGGEKEASIDWSKFEGEIRHKDLVSNLKAFHDQQLKVLDSIIAEDHQKAVESSHKKSWDALYESCLGTAKKSVEKSEDIVANGAKALYISYNNPPINTVSTSEWLDVDQYWQAFVEKHHHYHNHLDCATEDPESAEYDTKIKTELMKNFKLHDEIHPRKDLLYQRPSYEYYSYFKGPFVEHMVFYLVKTGGDARMFPELLPHKWFNQIYEVKFKLLDVLQERRRTAQLQSLARELDPEFHPHNLVAEGEGYYTKLIQKENVNVEMQVARLMGNFMFLNEGVGVQTSAALYNLLDGEAAKGGKLYSLGEDVNALFWVPSSEGGKGSAGVSPREAASSYLDHLTMSGKKLPPVMAVALEEFCGLLEDRKAAMSGVWFNTPDETPADCFLRRIKIDDPCKEVYHDYVTELNSRWEAKTELSAADAIAKIAQIEKHYLTVEVPAYETLVYGGDNPDAKVALDTLYKMDDMEAKMDGGEMLAFDAQGNALSADRLNELITKSG